MATRTAPFLVFAISLATLGFVLSANANERKTAIITFDAPDAGTNAFGTFPLGINLAGAIEGYFLDAGNTFHGFLRAPDGTFTTIDG